MWVLCIISKSSRGPGVFAAIRATSFGSPETFGLARPEIRETTDPRGFPVHNVVSAA
jgi:hypothetical protein